MRPTGLLPRKQRTREHVIAALSVNHVERFILEEGHVVLRVETDYGYDLILFTHDERGFVEPDFVFLQLKAAEQLKRGPGRKSFVFDITIEDYNLWTSERMPVYLILYDASRRRAYWLDVQAYFRKDSSRRPRRGRKTVRVHVPARQAMTRRAVAKMRARKQALAVNSPEGEDDG